MRPLIFDFTVNKPNVNAPEIHHYDHRLSLSVLPMNGENKVLIDINPDDLELYTQTMMNNQFDDAIHAMSLGTKTHGTGSNEGEGS